MNGGRRLRQPLGLKVRREHGMILIESDLLGIFGHGETVSAALADLRRDLEYYWSYYARLDQSEVAGEGARLKRVYASLPT